MKFIDNLSLRAKLFLLSGLTGAVLTLAIVYILSEVRQISHDTTQITAEDLPALQQAAALSQLRLRYRVRSLEFLLPDPPENAERITRSLESLNNELMAEIEAYRPFIRSPAEQAMLEQIIRSVTAYHQSVGQAREMVGRFDMESAQQLRRTVWVEHANAVRDAIDALVEYNRERADAAASSVDTNVDQALRGGIIVAMLGVALGIALTLLFAARMSGRLRETVTAVQEIASGNLQSKLPEPSHDEVGALIRSVGEMQGSLRETITLSRDSAHRLAESAKQLTQSANEVSEGAAAQSDAASNIAANVEELTVSISHVSERTTDASRIAGESGESARDGKRTVDRLVAGMREVESVVGDAATRIGGLQEQSEKISRIVAVIREIAEQTNLLALNAAIEAARAGEQGRGFAVVADEVRKLSERTAQSTEEIAQMVEGVQHSTHEAVSGIERGVEAVRTSSEEATQTGDTINRLQELAQQVADIVTELDSALREQSMASSEVARRVEQIAERAEESSSATRQSVESAQALDALADEMLRLVQRFKV